MANNIAQKLRVEIEKEMRKAMNVASAKAEADMYHQTGDFYTESNPKKYIRTGALGDTPRVTALMKSGNQMSFEAYLDKNHTYDTGKNPTMTEVLLVANDHGNNPAHLRHPIGKEGFWDRAVDEIEQDFNSTMKSFFR